jgi:hypothetical protein
MDDDLPYRYDVEVVGLLASPAHRYGGRPDAAVAGQPVESRDRIEVRAALGIIGDRYFGQPAHRDASVTVLAAEVLDQLADELVSGPLDPLATRRNVVLRGAEVEALPGQLFSLDCGEGEVALLGGRPANPAPGWTWCSPPAPTGGCAGGLVSVARLAPTAACGWAQPCCAAPSRSDAARAGGPVRPAPRKAVPGDSTAGTPGRAPVGTAGSPVTRATDRTS